MKFALKTRSGFTLIEVALGATILAVAFIGMIDALAIGSEMLDTARKQTIAAQIMQAEAEYLRMQPWSTISSLASKSPDYLSNYADFNPKLNHSSLAPSSLATFANTSFKFSRTVNTNPHANLRWITMTVSWTSITGKAHQRSSNLYIGKYGLNVSYQKP
ncbi:MAG: hypothetical protein PHE83_07750 [Opitutaceae bacterium]|nr:hypothetical protein [Opitutaceae bacterium]